MYIIAWKNPADMVEDYGFDDNTSSTEIAAKKRLEERLDSGDWEENLEYVIFELTPICQAVKSPATVTFKQLNGKVKLKKRKAVSVKK